MFSLVSSKFLARVILRYTVYTFDIFFQIQKTVLDKNKTKNEYTLIQCLSLSTSRLVFGCWLMSHKIYRTLRQKKLSKLTSLAEMVRFEIKTGYLKRSQK
jgi:hypothetical protein